jgi:hypothetical protein
VAAVVLVPAAVAAAVSNLLPNFKLLIWLRSIAC